MPVLFTIQIMVLILLKRLCPYVIVSKIHEIISTSQVQYMNKAFKFGTFTHSF